MSIYTERPKTRQALVAALQREIESAELAVKRRGHLPFFDHEHQAGYISGLKMSLSVIEYWRDNGTD